MASLCSQHKVHCPNLAHGPFMSWPLLISPTAHLSPCSTPTPCSSWNLCFSEHDMHSFLLLGYSHVLCLLPATFTPPLSPTFLSPSMCIHFLFFYFCLANVFSVFMSQIRSFLFQEVFLEHPHLAETSQSPRPTATHTPQYVISTAPCAYSRKGF